MKFKLSRILAAAAVIALVCTGAGADSRSGDVMAVRLSGTVGVQMENFVSQSVRDAEDRRCSLIIFELDTPGGLVEAMRGIVQSILASRVPTAVWVPPGGRAASAGAFIVQAAHAAAMAPGTNIGAAHPVVASGGDIPDGDMNLKVMNDLKAQMRSVTQLRGRNQEMAERMIEESVSLTAQEALKENVIDVIAGDIGTLITALSGRTVQLETGPAEIDVRPGAMVLRSEMSWREQIIQFVSSPEIAYLLLSGGMMAIFFEVITPGGFMLGTAGGVMLLLGAIGLKMLPFSWAGVLLLCAGVLLMGLDMFAGSGGLLSLLGLPVFCLGGVFLFRAPGGELLRFSLSAVVGASAVLGACFVFFAFLAIKGMRRRVTTGFSGMEGLIVTAISGITADEPGQVRCRGEIWRARSADGAIAAGRTASVVAVDGMTLIIRQAAAALPANVSKEVG